MSDVTIPAGQPSTPAGAPKPEERATEFRPVDGSSQVQSGEKLLVEAYAAIWMIVFAMVYMSWRRLAQVDKRIAGLEAAIAKARVEAAKGSGKPYRPDPRAAAPEPAGEPDA